MTPRVYPSKRDAWLIALAGLGALVALVDILIAEFTPGAFPMRLVLSFLVVLPFGFLAWLFATTGYTFAGEELLVRSGPFSWRVPLAKIDTVKPSRSMLSAPALSLDRLEICYGRSTILISPADREGFLQDLLGKCPHLRRQGEVLERGEG